MVMNHYDSAFNRHPNPVRGCAESVNWNLKGAKISFLNVRYCHNRWLSTGENPANPKTDRCFSDFLPKRRMLLCGIAFALLYRYILPFAPFNYRVALTAGGHGA